MYPCHCPCHPPLVSEGFFDVDVENNKNNKIEALRYGGDHLQAPQK
jgi:hypothetical protein